MPDGRTDADNLPDDLRWHWGAYVISHLRPGVWVAQRRDTNDTIRADTAGRPARRIVAD